MGIYISQEEIVRNIIRVKSLSFEGTDYDVFSNTPLYVKVLFEYTKGDYNKSLDISFAYNLHIMGSLKDNIGPQGIQKHTTETVPYRIRLATGEEYNTDLLVPGMEKFQIDTIVDIKLEIIDVKITHADYTPILNIDIAKHIDDMLTGIHDVRIKK